MRAAILEVTFQALSVPEALTQLLRKNRHRHADEDKISEELAHREAMLRRAAKRMLR